eukprot:TRINITY_DN4880_c4_g1_i1.p1 TRINITY_DN4880_c4_g1~~TRINITY_DN4880_c4_g1_i1.p1  ORF type:complete len:788 (-),score=189.57 TRINITY_DN4880_c4_g1_i1:39-2402(-)
MSTVHGIVESAPSGKATKGGKGKKGGGKGKGKGKSPATGPAASPSMKPKGGAKGRGKGKGKNLDVWWAETAEEADIWEARVRKQVEFYFSEANLAKDTFLQAKLREGSGWVQLDTILKFNRIWSLGCRRVKDLAKALEKSDVVRISEDKKKVQRNVKKAPVETFDASARTVYVEGLPLTFSVDDLVPYFAQYGKVNFVQIPRHAQTREPRGFCFVEFATEDEAEEAAEAIDDNWPETWPTRYDGRTLRALTKQRWQQYQEEYKMLKRLSAGASGRLPEPTDGGEAAAAAAALMRDAQTMPASTASSSSTAPAGATQLSDNTATSGAGVRPVRRGIYVHISGFSQPQCRTTVRQWAEHAVAVEYCDYVDGADFAILTLQDPSEVEVLLEDARVTGRLLGWSRPEIRRLTAAEEDEHVEMIQERRAKKAAEPKPTLPDGQKLSRKAMKRKLAAEGTGERNPHGLVHGGPTMNTLIQRVKGVEQPPQHDGGMSFTDTNGNRKQAGFSLDSKRRRVAAARHKRDAVEAAAAANAGGPLAQREASDLSGSSLPPAVSHAQARLPVRENSWDGRQSSLSGSPPHSPHQESWGQDYDILPPLPKHKRTGGFMQAALPPPSPWAIPSAKPKRAAGWPPRRGGGQDFSMLPASASGSIAEAGIGPLLPPPSPVAVRGSAKTAGPPGGGAWLPPPSPVAVRPEKPEAQPRRQPDGLELPPASPLAIPADAGAAAQPAEPGDSAGGHGADDESDDSDDGHVYGSGAFLAGPTPAPPSDVSGIDSMLDLDTDDIIGLMD